MSSSTSPGNSTVVASGATLTAEIYPHLLVLVPELSKVAPASALAWITTLSSSQHQLVEVHVFKTDAIISTPQYAEKAPITDADSHPAVLSMGLPDSHALIATLTFTDVLTVQSPVILGPAAPAIPPHLHFSSGKGKDKARKTTQSLPTQEHARAAYAWCEKQAAAQGQQLPWPASPAALAQVGHKQKWNASLVKDRVIRLLFRYH